MTDKVLTDAARMLGRAARLTRLLATFPEQCCTNCGLSLGDHGECVSVGCVGHNPAVRTKLLSDIHANINAALARIN